MNKIILLLTLYILISDNVFSENLTLVTDSWHPYYGNNINGFFEQLTKEVFALEGIELKVVYLPWTRAMVMAKGGEHEGVLGAYYTEDRSNYFYYSDPVITSQTVLVSIDNIQIDTNNYDTLIGKRVGITKGYFYNDKFDHIKGVRFVTSYSVLESLERMLIGEIELVTADKQVVSYYYNLFKENKELIYHYPAIAEESLYILISKKSFRGKYLISKFNSGLRKLKESGRYFEIIPK